MRIFIIGHSSRTGGGVSVEKCLFRAIGRVAPEHDYFFTIPPNLGFEECCRSAPHQEYLIYHTSGHFRRWCWETFRLPAIIKAFHPDVILSGAHSCLVSPPCPQAILIRNAQFFYPSTHFGPMTLLERIKFYYHRYHFRKCLKATKLIFCQTRVAEKRLRDVYKNDFSIKLCQKQLSLSIPSAKSKSIQPDILRHAENKFKLFVLTRYYPHKNLEIIFRLFQKYRQELRDVMVILTITSDQHRNAARLLGNVAKAGLDKNIITVGPLPQEELPAYYEHTDALFLPTLLESYSGTYIETMQFGRPILTSDMDFAHEVCGDAAIYFDPRDIDDIYDKIIRLKNDKGLYRQLVEAGKMIREIQPFTWDDIAHSVIRELKTLVG